MSAEPLCDAVRVLIEHAWVCDDQRICRCGWRPDDYQERLGRWDDDRDYAWMDDVVAPAHAVHVATVLDAAGQLSAHTYAEPHWTSNLPRPCLTCGLLRNDHPGGHRG